MHHKKIKIIHIMHSLEIGGLENGVVNLVNRANPDFFEFVICCIRKEGALRSRIRPSVKIVCLKEKEGFSLFRFLKLAKLFRQEMPDIVHTHGWGSDYLSGVVGGLPDLCAVR